MDSISEISSQQMLVGTEHITDDLFFFQEDSTGALCVQHSPVEWKMWCSCFLILPGSAEAQVLWSGIVKSLLTAYFIGKISAKKCQNQFMCVKVTASQRWGVF